jgi:hypothetical protein
MVSSQEMRRNQEKGIFGNDVGCPRAFLIRKATMGTKFWWFSRCCSTDMDCTFSNLQHMYRNWQIRLFDPSPSRFVVIPHRR